MDMTDSLTNHIEVDEDTVHKHFTRSRLSTALVRMLEAPALRWRDHGPGQRCQREQQALRELPDTPQLHEAGEQEVAMEHIDGERLDAVLQDPEAAAEAAPAVAGFIDELEDADTTLVDSRTSNFLIQEDGLARVDTEFMDPDRASRLDEITLLATVFHAPRHGAQSFIREYRACRRRTPPLVYTLAAVTGIAFALMVERSPRHAVHTVQNYLSLFL